LPIVNVATVCEKILRETDNVASLIRVIDVFHLPQEAVQLQPEGSIPVSALIVVRGGDYRGEGEIAVSVHTPDGKQQDFPEKWPMLFSDAVPANSLVLNFGMAFKHVGTSWIDVLWNGELLTKFPITLALQSAALPAPTA